jgi:hypothetical protein
MATKPKKVEQDVEKPIKLKAVLKWAYLNTKNELSNAYQVNLTQLSAGAVSALAAVGIEASHKEEDGFFIVGKSKLYPITAQFPDGEVVSETVKVGNGTEVVAVVGAYDWTFKNKKGRSPSIKKLVITKLVEYSRDDEEDAEDPDGIGEIESDIV